MKELRALAQAMLASDAGQQRLGKNRDKTHQILQRDTARHRCSIGVAYNTLDILLHDHSSVKPIFFPRFLQPIYVSW